MNNFKGFVFLDILLALIAIGTFVYFMPLLSDAINGKKKAGEAMKTDDIRKMVEPAREAAKTTDSKNDQLKCQLNSGTDCLK